MTVYCIHEDWERNHFHFDNNDKVPKEYLRKNDVHLKDNGTQIFVSNFVNFLNDLISNRNTRLVNDATSTHSLLNEEYISKAKNDVGDTNINVELWSLRVKNLNKLMTGHKNINRWTRNEVFH